MARLTFCAIGTLAVLAASAFDARADTIPASDVKACPPQVAAAADLERNKDLVRTLFDIIYASSQEGVEQIDELVAADYIQHNPSVGQGREGLRQLLLRISSGAKELDPKGTLSVNLIAEGDFVVRQEVRTDGMLVDIFRIQDGKLQEHWDAFRFAPGAKRIPGF